MDTEIPGTRASGRAQGNCVRAFWASDRFHPPMTVPKPLTWRSAAGQWPGGLKSSYLVLKPVITSAPCPHTHTNTMQETPTRSKGELGALPQQN